MMEPSIKRVIVSMFLLGNICFQLKVISISKNKSFPALIMDFIFRLLKQMNLWVIEIRDNTKNIVLILEKINDITLARPGSSITINSGGIDQVGSPLSYSDYAKMAKKIFPTGEQIGSEFVCKNAAIMMYEPMLGAK